MIWACVLTVLVGIMTAFELIKKMMRGYEPEPEAETTPQPRPQLQWRRMVLRLKARIRIDQRLLGQTASLVELSRLRRSMPRNAWSLTVVELREILRRAGLPTSGLKADLVQRLKAHLSQD